MEGRSYLVTGGGGYFGYRLLSRLVADGADKVRVLDVREPAQEWVDALPPDLQEKIAQRVEFMKADIRDRAAVWKAVDGMDVVFHVASFGMSGREQLQREKIMAINVGGSQTLVDACIDCSVPVLIYTSTTNVVFAGNELANKDETQPYLPLDKHVDYYSRTKSIAEQTILAANGTPLKKARSDHRDRLLTCAIRAAGIYGEGEERHLPRIVGLIKKGLFCFTIGTPDSKVEFVYVDNLVHAHILASAQLYHNDLEESKCAGRSYFISDWEPVNNFQFFRPLLELYGYSYPSLNLPVSLMFYLAFGIELVHRLVGQIYNFQPLLTRAEVYKVGVTHYFSPDHSKNDLGYQPLVSMKEGMGRVLAYYRQKDRHAIGEKGSKRMNCLEQLLALLPVLLFVMILVLALNSASFAEAKKFCP